MGFILRAPLFRQALALCGPRPKTAISDHHADAREGMAAFREKRKPRFNQSLEEG